MTSLVRAVAATGAVVLTAALAGCDTGAPDDPLAAADCDAIQRPQLQEGSHLIGDAEPPVPYSSSPPTSGWHTSGRPLDPGTYLDEVSGPAQVRVLEQGGIVLSHAPDLPSDQLDRIQRLPTEVDGVVVTPDEDAAAPVTLTAWGVLQRCEDVTADEVTVFREAHAREPGH